MTWILFIMTLGFDFRICSQDQTTFKATHDVKLHSELMEEESKILDFIFNGL
jgi:hypothetical protein